MAKPGSPAARELAALRPGAVDLGALKASKIPAVREEVLRQVEMQLGMRCRGCGERITIGFRFHSIEVEVIEGEPQVVHLALAACNDCGYANELRAGAVCVEMLEYAWLTEAPAPQPAAAA